MYLPTSGCSAILHLLVKHPILTVVFGLALAAAFVAGQLQDRVTYEEIENSPEFQAKIKASEQQLELAEQTEPVFEGILRTETKGNIVGVHPDGVSYGPAGLTKGAVQKVLRDIPNCVDLGYDEVLLDSESNKNFAYLYFLNLVHEFGSVETAIIAYNIGPNRVRRLLRQGKKLPQGYLKAVKRHLEE